MKLIFLGTGSAFTLGDKNFQSNLLLESGSGRRLLIDCGTDARFALFEQGFTYRDIHDVCISRLQTDCAGGLEWLAFSTLFDPEAHRIRLLLSQDLVGKLWTHVLSGGLSSLQGVHASLNSYFDVQPLVHTALLDWEGIRLELIPDKSSEEISLHPSYSLFLHGTQAKVFLAVNTQRISAQIQHFYEQATHILQDCETLKTDIHTNFDQLAQLPPVIKKKMWLYHYQPGQLPDAKAYGFAGFVKKGQSFIFD